MNTEKMKEVFSDEALEQVSGGLGFTALFAVAYALAGVSSLGTLSGFAWLMDSVIVDRTGRHW